MNLKDSLLSDTEEISLEPSIQPVFFEQLPPEVISRLESRIPVLREMIQANQSVTIEDEKDICLFFRHRRGAAMTVKKIKAVKEVKPKAPRKTPVRAKKVAAPTIDLLADFANL